ncbi:hypothetical protein B7P43_G01642 [Cryptotermes secundus]|uniref:Uncharacterized protein n=1 Tax=Cryptotermes secundus TaxID=105785 RepID=A0A2J7PR51_9NEOP|nr:hypothetical protein B7P43_G01642 [Cryptotermes secundus]
MEPIKIQDTLNFFNLEHLTAKKWCHMLIFMIYVKNLRFTMQLKILPHKGQDGM